MLFITKVPGFPRALTKIPFWWPLLPLSRSLNFLFFFLGLNSEPVNLPFLHVFYIVLYVENIYKIKDREREKNEKEKKVQSSFKQWTMFSVIALGGTMALYFKLDRTKPDGSFKVYDINRLKDNRGHDLCSQLLFIHAMTGCDTTSLIFGVGKECFPDPVLQSWANAFTIPNQTTLLIEDLGCQVMSFLFGGKHSDSLETMRYNIFLKTVVSSSSFITPERLPSTESATKLHCRRVYYQIMV